MSDVDIAVHPVAALFPMRSDEELALLAEDIKANGLIHPVVLDVDGVLVDGRNRYAACRLGGVEPTFATLPEGTDLVAYILRANVARRHLRPGQAAMLAVDVMFRTEHRYTQRALAAIAGVGLSRINHALFVWEHAPDLAPQVEAGASLDEAYRIAVERKRRAETLEASNQKRLEYIEAERERALAAIERSRQEIGPAVQIPPEPDLTIAIPMADDGAARLVLGDGDDLDELKAQQALLAEMRAVKQQIARLGEHPIAPSSPYFEGLHLAVRAWTSQVVSSAYRLVRAYNDALVGEQRVRRVK